MWSGSLLRHWLTQVGLNTNRTDGYALEAPVSLGPYVPSMPNRIAVATFTPGAGLTNEGVLDRPGFQLRVRGWQGEAARGDDYTHRMAMQFDRDILFADFPTTVTAPDGDSAYLLRVTRAGGGPAPLGNADQGGRLEFVCTYLAHVSTD